MSPSYENRVLGSQFDFSGLTRKPHRARSDWTMALIAGAFLNVSPVPIPSSKKIAIRIPCDRQWNSKGLNSLVKVKGALEMPNGRNISLGPCWSPTRIPNTCNAQQKYAQGANRDSNRTKRQNISSKNMSDGIQTFAPKFLLENMKINVAKFQDQPFGPVFWTETDKRFIISGAASSSSTQLWSRSPKQIQVVSEQKI